MEINRKPQTENEQRVAEEYLSSLADLNCNSKPLINMLTMLAEENIDYAAIIVKVVEQHIAQVPPEFKLPILYLIDSIVKNVKGTYVQLFSHCIVNIFCGVFEMVHEKIRERMYALRQTWNEVFSPQKLYALDIKVKRLDTNWPITAKQPPKPSIHVNPDFLKNVNVAQTALPSEMEEILQVKTRELLELKKRKLELELEQTKKHLEEQEQQLNQTTSSMAVAPIAGVPQPVAGGAAFAPGMNARMAAPGVAPAELLHQQQQQQQKMAGLRPGFIRGVRPAQPPTATQAVAPGVLPIQGQGFPQVNNAVNKLKVNPVNPALLNTMRQRDPRLARQSQQQQPSQQQQQQQHLPPPLARNHADSRTDSNKSSSHRHGNSSKSSRSRSKSPTRHSSSSSANHRSGSSSGRSHKSSSSRRAGASSDKDRKRSESKSSTASSSSSSSTTSDRRKGTAFSSSTLLSTTTTTRDKSSISATTVKNNYDTFDIESLSGAAQKRKSSSPAASPTKSKRSSKSSHRSSNKSTRSRSRSPNDYKDVDMRTTIIRSNVTPEKRLKLDQDMDNKQSSSTTTSTGVSNNTTNDLEKPNSTFTTTTTSSSLPTAASSATTAAEILGSVAGSSTTVAGGAVVVAGNVSDALKDSISKLMSTAQVNKEQQNHLICGEKRASAMTATTVTDLEEPAQKKSKSTKMDMLFGSEDVDLRKEILTSQAQNTAVTLAQKKTQGGIVTPPPTTSSSSSSATTTMTAAADESELSLSAAENWDNDKHSPKKNAMLDEIRAKLAKAAKSNKLNKNAEKPAKDQAQRFKLAELNINDDSQEANDEKIRIILTQAQEMFDNKGMNQDQYKDLVQKMMSINEASKLKEAKRREAAHKSSTTDDNDATNDLPEERERNAARDAVLRKRIPKIIKAAAQANENHTMNDSPRSDGNDSPIYDDVAGHVDNDNNATNSSKPHTSNNKSSNKDKRRKPSKWGEQIDTNTNAGQQRPTWLSGNAATSNNNMNNKRMIGIFRSQQMNINMRLNAPMPWQRGTTMAQTFVGPMIGAPRSTVPPPPQPPNMISMPPVPPNIPKPCNSIDNPQADIMRSITIDGTAKEIRIYNQVAIVFMQGDVPHEIGFQPGQRALIIDNMEPFKLQFNDTYKPITIDGILHHIRFGFPSRELYIDDQWYEIYFGGPPVSIPIRNKLHILKAEGPPPQVNIGAVRRDLVIGKISMIVDAYTIVPLFLDAKVQTFQLGDQQHTIQFVDSFINVLFDGEIHKVEYGGLPKSIALGGRKYFIRFGTLPPGIVAGKVQIQDMVYIKTEAPLPEAINPAQAVAVAGPVNIGNELKTEPIADPALQQTTTTTAPVVPVPVPAAAAALGNLNIDELFQKLVSSGIIGGTATNAVPVAKTTDEETNSNATSAAATVPTAPTVVQPTETNAKTVEVPPAASSPAPPAEIIHPINLSKTETIKARQAAIISTIFSGMQCSSCGVRFPPEQTIKYSQHLDWHFRQNRRERDSSRKALSRKWYYALADWIQYEEIEDLEERDKNFLEAQQNGPEAFDEASNQRSVGSPAPSCAAGPDDVDRACDMCQEKFEQFYNEELEEWHLRSAVRVDDKIYHPLCYEDYKASLKPPVEPAKTEDESKDNALNTTDDNAVDIVIKIESEDKDESKNGATEFDDDDDVIVLPNEEPSVMEIIDDDGDDEYVPANVTREEMGISHHESGEPNQQQQQQKTLNETMESDVEIQEPHIPFTDLDNYVEKELPPLDEATRAALLNVKIKEEPKDEFDEDDGFEDVGTVMLVPGEEISIQSSEDTQTHTITSSASPATIERPPSVASLTQNDALELEPATPEQSIIDLNASMDGNLETQETHNLSAAGPAPALPLASLVNKIKINITKNTSSSNSNNSNSNNSASNTAVSTTKSASTTTNAGEANVVSAISVVSNCTTTTSVDNKTNNNSSSNSNVNTNNLGEVNNIQTISTIPVLCGGSTVVPKITTTSMSSSSTTGGTGSAPANISTISVIGSSNYGISNTRFAAMMSKPTLTTPSTVSTSTTSTSATTTGSSAAKAVTTTRQATPPPAAEPEPTIVFKPALRNIALKKTKKIVNGVETSGLCSIM